MSKDDKRLIEDYLPIQAISAEASREKSVRKGHISTLHLWWARRPLVACRAAVYGALVPESRFAWTGESKKRKKRSGKDLGRAEAERFVERLCKYPGDPKVIAEAEQHILEAHAERLSKGLSKKITVEDIVEGRAPRPKVMDMFAGGGAIPLEALRLGCDTYAIDLNPVAHIIELCTLMFPQKFGKPDPNARGMMGPKNENGETTWGGLVEEARHWGNWILQRARSEMGDLYPLIPDPKARKRHTDNVQAKLIETNAQRELNTPVGYLLPVAYVWTRTVNCKNRSCGSTVPLVRQTWLSKKKGCYIAVKATAPKGEKRVRFCVVESSSEKGLGFDPSTFSRGGNATCFFCGTVADIDYVKSEGCSRRIGQQLMAVVCEQESTRGKRYVDADPEWERVVLASALERRVEEVANRLGITIPDEQLEANPRSFDVQHFGFRKWRDVFGPRQLIAMVTFAGLVKLSHSEMLGVGYDAARAKGLTTCLSMILGRLADYCTSFCTWQPEFVAHTFDTPGLPMIMDFAEANPLVDSSGGWPSAINYVMSVLAVLVTIHRPCSVLRGSAINIPQADETFDAVVTDPPYYDSRSYSNLSDHFYVWHKRAIGNLYPEHFGSELTPKKNEAIAAPYRHNGVRKDADIAYERLMQKAFEEARRLLKPGAPMTCVYAHKTTAGWATLINSLMKAGFTVVEAWPCDMERKVRQNAQGTAALASSIFLVARKRTGFEIGSYEGEVRPDLEATIRERVDTLWGMGITGADLVVAAVGAGLRSFTRFKRIEYSNGEEVPTERFLSEVEGVVLETVLERLFNLPGSKVSAVDPISRFYVLWRYTYGRIELDAGEAIVFAYPQGIELDGQKGLTQGPRALLTKKKSKYVARDYTDRGEDEKLGVVSEAGEQAPLVDVLHRILWLLENRPRSLPAFLDDARPDRERLRLVAQALAGPALRGKPESESQTLLETTSAEQIALGKLLANWRSLIDARLNEFRLS